MDETKITAAERAWQQSCEKLRSSATELEADCLQKLQTFRGYADRDLYKAEMSVLGRRLEWLSAALDSNPEKVRNLIAQQRASATQKVRGPSSAASEAQTTPDDLSAMGRAPPCAAWAAIISISELQALGDFQGCRSQKDIRDKTDSLKKPRADLQSLVSATKSAGNDLSTAKKRADINRKKALEKAKKNEEQKKKASGDDDVRPRKKRSGAGASAKHPPLLNLELGCLMDVPRLNLSDADAWDSHSLLQPWVFRGHAIIDPEDPDIKDFATVFKNSSLRVTQGHATRKLGEASQGSCCAAAESMLKDVFKVGPSREGGAGPTWDPALAKGSLAPAFFGMVAHHCSLAKFETAMAPMMKYISAGTLLVSMWVPRALVFPSEESGRAEGAMMTSDFQAAAVKATEDDVRGACCDIYMCTVGPKDMLYVPPGALFSSQARCNTLSLA